MTPHGHEQMARFERVWDAAGPDRGIKSALAEHWCADGAGDMMIMKLLNHRTRARRSNAKIYTVSPKDWARLLERYRHCCAYCGGKKPLTLDHVVPLTRGGWHGVGNILPVCHNCNSKKGGHLLIEHLRKVKRRQLVAKRYPNVRILG